MQKKLLEITKSQMLVWPQLFVSFLFQIIQFLVFFKNINKRFFFFGLTLCKLVTGKQTALT